MSARSGMENTSDVAGAKNPDDVGGTKPPTVAVIIPTFNHARFLPAAIGSVLGQTRPPDEIVVVDDGSSDDPASAVAAYVGVKLVRQENQGPSAARNLGLRHIEADYVTFLDADDIFLPTAIESGLACFAANPACGFVYGASRRVSESGQPLGPDHYDPLHGYVHIELLKRNAVSVHHAVLYRRSRLVAIGAFDEAIRRGEDLEVYLRLALKYPVASHPNVIAEYRRHGFNTSNNHTAMLRSVIDVLDKHAVRFALDGVAKKAIAEGRKRKCDHYAYEMLASAAERWRRSRDFVTFLKEIWRAFRWAPGAVSWAILTGLMRRGREFLRGKGRAR